MSQGNVTTFPAASLLGYAADCYTLQRVLAEVCMAHSEGPLHVIETGVCDGGSSFLLLLANPRIRLLSMTWPGSRGAQAHENRESSNVAHWALPRLPPEALERWRVVARDSTLPDWPRLIEELGEQRWGPPRFVFLDGSHARDDVLAELRNVRALDPPPVVMVHDAETDGPQQAFRIWEAEGGGSWQYIEGTKLARVTPRPLDG